MKVAANQMQTPAANTRDWVIEFVHDRDVPCPRCGYNLRDLVEPKCPECAEPLVLQVGVQTPKFGWLIATMAPGLFSGVCATLMLFPLVIVPLWLAQSGVRGGTPASIYFAEVFGIASIAAAVALYTRRRWFLRLPVKRQQGAAAGVWFVHIAAFVLVLLTLR